MLFFAFVDVFLSLESKYQKSLNDFGFVVIIVSDGLQLLQIFKSFQQSCKIVNFIFTFDINNATVFSLKMHLLVLKAPDLRDTHVRDGSQLRKEVGNEV